MTSSLVNIEIPLQYKFIEGGEELLVLFHGYKQTGHLFYECIKPLIPSNYSVLYINGIFPVPDWKDGEIFEGYSWYFFDPRVEKFIIDMKPSVLSVTQVIRDLGLESQRKRLVGYSQGGYFAPFVASSLTNVHSVVSVAARYRVDDLRVPLYYKCHCIHGERDQIVEYAGAKSAFDQMKELGQEGEFFSIPGLGHKMKTELFEPLRLLLSDDRD